MIAGGAAAGFVLARRAADAVPARRKKRRRRVDVAYRPSCRRAEAPPRPCAAGGRRQHRETQMESKLAERDALQQKMDAQALSSLKLAPVITKKAEVWPNTAREDRQRAGHLGPDPAHLDPRGGDDAETQ